MDPISSSSPNSSQISGNMENTRPDDVNLQTQQNDASTEQLEQAKEAARQELAQQQAHAGKEKMQAYATEIVNLFETVVQEGVEGYQPPTVDQGAGAFTEDHGSGFTPKEQAILREFLREVQHLVHEQGTDLAMALRQLQSQQGGKFWQRFLQVMTGKTPSATGHPFIPGTGKGAGLKEGAHQGAKPGEGMPWDVGFKPGTQAMMEMIRAETNPKAHVDAMISALALLKQEGLDRSYRELVQHLRNRWGLSAEEMDHFLKRYPVIYFQGPMPGKRERNRNVPWYPLIAILSIPLAKVLGLSWLGAAASGILLALLLYLAARLARN